MLFYLKLLEETGDICTLDRAYVSLRADKRVTISPTSFSFLITFKKSLANYIR